MSSLNGAWFTSAAATNTKPLPLVLRHRCRSFLAALRRRVAKFAARDAEEFMELLVTEYPPGAPIGWHRGAPGFDIIVGVPLLSECTMQFRQWPVEKAATNRVKPLKQILEPRSSYILRGRSRARWQHRTPPVKQRSLSITFRTLRTRLV